MPIYEYRCDQGHVFEVRARMVDDPVTSCLTCEASVQRVFHPIAVHFKGSGFYNTDYGKRKRGSSTEGSDGEGSASSDVEAKKSGDGAKKSGEGSGSGESKGSSSDGKGSGDSKRSGDSGSKSAAGASSS